MREQADVLVQHFAGSIDFQAVRLDARRPLLDKACKGWRLVSGPLSLQERLKHKFLPHERFVEGSFSLAADAGQHCIVDVVGTATSARNDMIDREILSEA